MLQMNNSLDKIIVKLSEIRDDIDAIHHHQSDRIVQELEEVIEALRNSDSQEYRIG